MKHIELSDNTALLITPTLHNQQSCMVERVKDGKRREQLGGIKIPHDDLVNVCVSLMFACGYDCKEILAEIYAQSFDVAPEIIEACMRR